MVQESVGRDLKSQAKSVPGNPLGLRYVASVPSGLLPDFRESFERMFAEHESRSLVEEVHVQFTKEGPAPRPMKGRKGLGGKTELVTVTSGSSRVPGMKIGVGDVSRFHPDIFWQSCVQGPVELIDFPSHRKGHRYNLAGGVDPTIRSTRCHYGAPGPR